MLCTCSFSAALFSEHPKCCFSPLPRRASCLQTAVGCGFAQCSFSEHAVFSQLMFVRPHAKVTAALKKANSEHKMLEKGE